MPGIFHKLRIIAGGADLSIDLTLATPVDNSTTAKTKCFFHKQKEAVESQGRPSTRQITDPFTNAMTLVIPFTGSSVEIGKRIERIGEKPKQTVVSTHVTLSVLPPQTGT